LHDLFEVSPPSSMNDVDVLSAQVGGPSVDQIAGTIAAAVEQQDATANEMSRNVAEAARGSKEITRNISGVAEAAQSTSRGVDESQQSVKELAQMSTQLRELVGQFKY
jgi:methyl-accepting chemotaxis protein